MRPVCRAAFVCAFILSSMLVSGVQAADDWATVTEDDCCIKIETDLLEAVIPKKDPKQWMTGIEKHSFVDKTTGFHEAGDGLMVIDWLMEAGSDKEWRDQLKPTDRYLWHEYETDPARKDYARLSHGTTRPKRMLEGPQLCPWMKPVQPVVTRGDDFVAIQTEYKYEYAAPGRNAGSKWTQLIVFPKGKRYFVLMDRIDTVNDSQEMFLRNDTPGCVRHEKGDTFSEFYFSYLGGPDGLHAPSSEFFEPFAPDEKFGYVRGKQPVPERFFRAYHLRDPKTGKDGPWLGGLTLEPSTVYEAWCSMRPGGIIVVIEEFYGKPIKAGQSFSEAFIVGYFDTIDEMRDVYDAHKGNTKLTVDKKGWRLEK
jgi:hypothetical protein